MNIQNVIILVEGHAEDLAKRWLARIRTEEGAAGYLELPMAALLERVTDTYRDIGLFLDQPRHEVIRHRFHETGRRRHEQGLSIAQLVRGIQLARWVLWDYVLEQGVAESTLNLYQAVALFRQIEIFFDWAVIFAVEGFYHEGP